MRAVVAVLFAALCFGTTGTAQALAHVDASPLAVGFARIALGGGLLALVTLRRRPVPAPTPVGGRVVVVVGAAGVLAYQPAFFAGTAANGVAVGTVVALGSAPVATGLLEAVWRRRVPGARWCLATGLALVGLVLVSGVVGEATGVDPVGVLCSVGAGAAYSLYAVAVKALLDRGRPAGRAVGAVFGAAAVVALPALALTSPGWLLTARGAALVLWLGVVTTTVAYLLFGAGLAQLPTTTVATLTLAEPLAAALLGVGLLGERLDVAAAVGVLVIAAGIAVLTVRPRRVRGLPGVPTSA